MDFLKEIKALVTEMREVSIPKNKKNKVKFEDFMLLLGAPQSLIKNADFFALPIISAETGNAVERDLVRKNLEKHYEITNYESGIKYLEYLKFKNCAYQFALFQADWEGKPAIDLEKLSEKNRKNYEKSRDFAKRLLPIVGDYGLYAWDICMGIDISRECYSAGYFSRQVALESMGDFARKSLEVYPNWEQFAIGVIAGATYFDFSVTEDEKHAEDFFQFMYKYVRALFTDKGNDVWNVNEYPLFRHYFKNLASNAELFPPNIYCTVSNQISLDNQPIGFMYREKSEDTKNSGWCMFSGFEDDKYLKNKENFNAFELNILCNYDPEILPLLSADVGTIYKRDENEKFVLQENDNLEEKE
jgi:hypothetical protein